MLNAKIPVITGPTATGKSDLTLNLAGKFKKASIINIDSRQAYQGLRILSGQDIPTGFRRRSSNKLTFAGQPVPYFVRGSIRLWGLDFVPPDHTLNIAELARLAWQIIPKETQESRQVILVGGSGLYLKAITSHLPQVHIPHQPSLRRRLEKLSLSELQIRLKKLSPPRWQKMNRSDRHNPRRLIRAIEIAGSSPSTPPEYQRLQAVTKFRLYALRPDFTTLAAGIRKRVQKRLRQGAVQEVKKLRHRYLNRQLPIYTGLGVSQILEHLAGKVSLSELIKHWSQAELAYAKRQLTWFRQQPDVIWYDTPISHHQIKNHIISWLGSSPKNSP